MVKKYFYSFWPGILWTLVIIILLLLPGSNFPKNNWLEIIHIDKWAHSFLFCFFILFWWLGYRKKSVLQQKNTLIKLVLAGILLGLTMEVIQHFWVKGRSFEIMDVLFDIAGSFLGSLFVRPKTF
ncbi:MAG TPA: VanZ family protein [Chitinophagaceae bacterium]|nr:VanZ family protein [Chitinophagaceae bacterium]